LSLDRRSPVQHRLMQRLKELGTHSPH
jgi:hypothetical protein